MCQGCVNEGRISQGTFDKIEAFNMQWPEAEWGPGHLVLSDCNIFEENIQFCLDAITSNRYEGHSQAENVATKAFLEGLLIIPEDDR